MSKKIFKAIGLMSGTSLDGIDAAIITTDGDEIFEFGEFITVEYEPRLQERLRRAVVDKEVNDDELERDMTLAHADAVHQLLSLAQAPHGLAASMALPSEASLPHESSSSHESESVGEPAMSPRSGAPSERKQDAKGSDYIIGFHGQTIVHRPDLGWSNQIGDGELLAKETGIETVYDFRNEDMRHGGQGAPLVPVFHRAITHNVQKPIAIVNIGGVANVTWIRENGEMLAFDTGPGNAMINDIVKEHFGKDYDEGGKIAASGTVDEEILADYVEDEYFNIKPPKSLDRDHFNLDKVKDLEPKDAVATLTAFTAMSIMMSNSYFDNPVEKFYICGGGRHNARIMQTLGARAAPIEEIGHNGDAFEAQAFAYLAVRAKLGLPITFPSTTGCKDSPVRGIAKISG